jgi:integrase
LTVADVGERSVLVQNSKAGTARSMPLNAEGASFFAELIAGKAPMQCLFLQADGTAFTNMVVSRAMRTACAAAKISPPVSFRRLRTAFGSLLINADTPLAAISKLLGHADQRMTLRTYAHLLQPRLQQSVESGLPSFTIPAAESPTNT